MRVANVIYFKSLPLFYFKEKEGVKNNTIRKFNLDDPKDFNRKRALDLFITKICSELDISITNTETGESFERQIKDVCVYDNMYIITWRT